MFANSLFILLSIFLILNSYLVIFVSHPVFSLLFLVLCFITSSFILFLIECELIALLFITIYVGAIAVLFLFAIMMLDFKSSSLKKNLTKYIQIGTIFGLILLYPLITEITSFFSFFNSSSPLIIGNNLGHIDWYDAVDSIPENEAIGHVLYNYFVLQFLLVGLILLVVLFGIVYLMHDISSYKINKQLMFKQLARSTYLK